MKDETFEKIKLTVSPSLKQAILDVLFSHAQGKEKAIKRQDLIDAVIHGYEHTDLTNLDERAFRVAIHGLRRSGSLICSAPGEDGGYWLAATWEEVNECTEREFHSKAMDLLETEKAMKSAAEKRFGSQEKMF